MDVERILTVLGTPEGKADPYPLYARLHDLGEVIPLGPQNVLVVSYHNIDAVLRDPGFLVNDQAAFEQDFPAWRDHPVFVQSADWILNINAPKHGRIRSLLAKTFTARRVAGMRPAIEAMADELLEDMADRGADGSAVEFMQEFAYLLPVTVICELIGIPESDRAAFRPLARDLAGIFELYDLETLPRIDAAAVELLDYFTDLAAKRRSDPRDDLLSDLLAISKTADGRLTDGELLHNMTLLLVAGFETTTNLLGNGLQIVLDRPEYVEGVGTGSVAGAAFVEEVLRFDSPVQLTSRRAYDANIGDVPVTGQTELVLLIGAGNCDPRRFANPRSFDPARGDGGPLSFGGGAHFCIGAALARLEGAVAFPRLFARFPKIAPAGEPTRRNTLLLRGFDTLPVSVA
ncbi:MAG: cytochrome P450 [Nocardiopsaceae bacterium]|jgi:cytochrome P450|nr:cytochrome P450 [Nocardiopsaceae bacterium]